jgi:hypothetical protein
VHHAQRLVIIQGERKRGKRTFKPYQVGDKVRLKGTNLKLSHPSAKLAARRYGPFIVSKVISPVVYRLELPPAWKIFNTFHAALLSPYKETEEHCYEYYDFHSFYRPNADRTDCRSRRGPIPEPAERKADRIPNPLDRDQPRSPQRFADMAPISHR